MTVLEPNRAALVAGGMTPAEAERVIRKIERLRASCGCDVGAWFMLAACVLYAVLWPRLLSSQIVSSHWMALLIGLSLIVCAAGIGKLAGISLARWRLRRLLSRLKGGTLRHG
ncbi:MAG TPA: hypothetical protein VGP73_19215 [Thermoanaerobaculia bacterium]